MFFVLTGDGKGKTTCAIGMGVRACGAGKKVLMIQFMKQGGSSEEKALSQIKNFKIKSFGRHCFILPKKDIKKGMKGVAPIVKKDVMLAKQGFELAQKALKQGKRDFLILDEANIALKYGLLNLKNMVKFLKKYGEQKDIVLTGRYCPKEIMRLADLVSEVKEIKHYFRKGVKQRKGIEC